MYTNTNILYKTYNKLIVQATKDLRMTTETDERLTQILQFKSPNFVIRSFCLLSYL